LQFFESHNPQHTPVQSANAAATQLTVAQATAFTALTKLARSAFDEAQNARNAAKTTTAARKWPNCKMVSLSTFAAKGRG